MFFCLIGAMGVCKPYQWIQYYSQIYPPQTHLPSAVYTVGYFQQPYSKLILNKISIQLFYIDVKAKPLLPFVLGVL